MGGMKLCAFVSFAALLIALLNAGDLAALAQGQSQMASIVAAPQLFLALVVAAGIIAGLAFTVIAAAETSRRRRRKFSCIKH